MKKRNKILGVLLYAAWALFGIMMNIIILNTFEVSKLGLPLVVYNIGCFMVLIVIKDFINELIEYDKDQYLE